MKISAKVARGVAAMVVLAGLAGVTARTQMGHPGIGTQTPAGSQIQDPMHQKNDPEMSNEVLVKQSRARNDERQKRLVSDTDKLLSLATSLHDDVAKTNKDVMSLDVIKRAEEIEKLAKSVKERMKG